MIIEEAVWIRKRIVDYNRGLPKSLLDVGSSSKGYRTVSQPFIDGYVFDALPSVKYLDIQPHDGVDYVFDAADPDLPSKITDRFEWVVSCSLMEHIEDRDAVARNIIALSERYVIVTAPHVWPHHGNPIDTMWRPGPRCLKDFFKGHGLKPLEWDLVYDLRGDWDKKVRHSRRAISVMMGEVE